MREKPVIGIVAKYNRDPHGRRSIQYGYDNIIKLLKENDSIPIIIPIDSDSFEDNIEHDIKNVPEDTISTINRVINNLDGIVLQGGEESSDIEIAYAWQSIVHKKPILGICSGFNNIARAIHIQLTKLDFNQILYHNVDTIGYRHYVSFPERSLLRYIFNCDSSYVNSIHKIGMNISDVDTKVINILATSPDNTVEAFGLKNRNDCVLAIKWHPELMMGNKNSHILFKYFVDKCKKSLYNNLKYSYKMK